MGLILGCIVGVVLHLLSVAIIAVFAGMGEAWSGQGDAHNFPANYCIAGLALLSIPVVIRLVCLSSEKVRLQQTPDE